MEFELLPSETNVSSVVMIMFILYVHLSYL